MHVTKLSKAALATAVTAAALGATPLANAGVGTPGKHPEGNRDSIRVPGNRPGIIAILKHPDGVGVPQIIAILKHPDGLGVPQIIAILKHPDGLGAPQIIAILKHPDILGVLRHRDRAAPPWEA